jgi:hypothetical protein
MHDFQLLRQHDFWQFLFAGVLLFRQYVQQPVLITWVHAVSRVN